MIIAVLLILLFGSSINAEPIDYHHYLREGRQQSKASIPSEEENATFWLNNAQQTLNKRLEQTVNKNTAKNVILFLGDGMSLATMAAARTHLGQRNNKTGEETFFSFEKFPFTGLSKTYCVDSQVPDSACTATAYLCGVKGNEATIGVTATVKLNDCEEMNKKENQVHSLAHLAQLAGKRSGTVTTTSITDASPSGIYSHTANREWQSDADVEIDKQDPKKCHDLAHQLIHGETGKNLNVIFGGGRSKFIPKNVTDEDGNLGVRNDNRNLIKEWKDLRNNTNDKYIYDLNGMKGLSNDTEHVLGLFDSDHMDYNLDRNKEKKPSLEEMMVKAIELLSVGDKGYFLFVEGGRIDHAHHGTLTRKALDETIEFHKAIETAVNITNEEDTLIIVTADHSHTMTINGYPIRGQDVLGIGGMGLDNLPYTTLSYANGPKGIVRLRPNITNDDFSNKNYQYPSLALVKSETHGGEDVGIFAKGPWAHLFIGTTEQNEIPYIITYASCLGDFVDCLDRSGSEPVINMSIMTLFSLAIVIFQRFL